MKNWFIALLASLLFVGTAQAADTGLWHNPARNGEGINLITRDSTLVLFFYTYRDNVTSIPPSVSPAPPFVEPVGQNSTVWYIGQADNFNGESASGVLYGAEAEDYPNASQNEVGEVEEVGTFYLLRDGDGWILEIDYSWNYLVPWFVSLYDVHEFPTALITK
jgi:hypothetical protein